MSASRYTHLDVEEILRVTDKAMLVRLEDGEHWIPLSQIADGDDYETGDVDVTLSVTTWFCEKEGLA